MNKLLDFVFRFLCVSLYMGGGIIFIYSDVFSWGEFTGLFFIISCFVLLIIYDNYLMEQKND